MDTSHNDKTDGLFGERDNAAGPARPKHPEPPLAGVFGEHIKPKPASPKLPDEEADEPDKP